MSLDESAEMENKANLRDRLKAEAGFVTRYATIGVFNFVADFCIFTAGVYLFHLPALVANTLSYALVFSLSFFLNRRWAFRATDNGQAAHHQFFRFIAVNIAALALSNTAVWLLGMVLPLLAAKLAAMALTIAFTFSGYRLFVFGNKNSKSRFK